MFKHPVRSRIRPAQLAFQITLPQAYPMTTTGLVITTPNSGVSPETSALLSAVEQLQGLHYTFNERPKCYPQAS